jgi:anti-sigma28 factor (negative regulator of flagellin synthesis)
MDNIFLFAKTPEELENNTKRVLQRLQENNLFLKPKKCEFRKEKVEWLGMIIQEGKISMDQGKLVIVTGYPRVFRIRFVFCE